MNEACTQSSLFYSVMLWQYSLSGSDGDALHCSTSLFIWLDTISCMQSEGSLFVLECIFLRHYGYCSGWSIWNLSGFQIISVSPVHGCSILRYNGVRMWLLKFLFSFLAISSVLLLVSCEGKLEKLDLNCFQTVFLLDLGVVLDSSMILYSWMKECHGLSDWIAFLIRFLET